MESAARFRHPRRVRSRPLAVLCLVLAVVGVVLAWVGALEGSAAADAALPSRAPFVAELLALLAVALVGRVLLSLLPPGPLGSHRPPDLPTTWAVCHLLGLLALTVQARLFSAAGTGGESPLLWTVPWILLAGARLVTLPGAMVPRHGLRSEAPSRAARLLGLAAALAALAPLGASLPGIDLWPLGAPPALGTTEARGGLLEGCALVATRLGADSADAAALLGPCTFAALLQLLAHGLATARRHTGERRLALLLLAAAPLGFELGQVRPALASALLAAGAGGALGLGWVRRADRRELWLAALACGGLGLAGEVPSACAGLAALVLASAAPARIEAGCAAAAGAALVLLDLVERAEQSAPVGAADLLPLPPLAPWGALWIVFAVAVAGALNRERVRRAARTQAPFEQAISGRFLLLLLVLAFLFSLGIPYDVRALSLPAAFLFAALELVRAERTVG